MTYLLLWLFGGFNTMLFLLSDELDDHDRSIIQSFRASREKGINFFYAVVWPLVTIIALYLLLKDIFDGEI